MIDFRDLVDLCKAEALANKFAVTETSNWHWFCREYSKMFHTELYKVMHELPPEHVVLMVFEERLNQYDFDKPEDFESLVEQVRRIEDPNYDENQSKEMDQFVEGIEQWEEQRQKEGRKLPIPKKSPFRQPKPEKPKKQEPKEGFIDLSYLSDENES